MKKLPEKITLFINWEDRFVTADVCEVIDKMWNDDKSFLEEYYPTWKNDNEEDLPNEYSDEFIKYCNSLLEGEEYGWEVKKVDFPY